MRIGIDIRELEKGKKTGIGRILIGLLDYISTNDSFNQYILFGNQNTDYKSDSPNIKRVIMEECITIFYDQIKLPIAISKERIELFFSPYFKAPLLSRCPFINAIHDITPIHHPSSLLSSIYYRFIARLSAKFAIRVITLSLSSKRDLIKVLRLDQRKIVVVYPGIHLREGYKDVRGKYGIKGRYILYIGGIKKSKNIETLIKAYLRLPSLIKREYQLVIGGGESRYTEYLKKIAEPCGNRVLFTGLIHEDDIGSIYRNASLFVFPSLYEGFGLPPLEAMACGVPVVASNTSSLPEVVGDAGILIDPLDTQKLSQKMREVLTDNSLRERLRRAGIERSKKFSTESSAKELLKCMLQY